MYAGCIAVNTSLHLPVRAGVVQSLEESPVSIFCHRRVALEKRRDGLCNCPLPTIHFLSPPRKEKIGHAPRRTGVHASLDAAIVLAQLA